MRCLISTDNYRLRKLTLRRPNFCLKSKKNWTVSTTFTLLFLIEETSNNDNTDTGYHENVIALGFMGYLTKKT